MRSHAAAEDFSGSALVARDGRILYQHAFGYANLEWKIPNDLQTKFEIGSMTKQFTALLVLQFVNEGRIKLDGHVSDYLPYFRKDTGNRVTVRQLLSHTSGIPNFISAPVFWMARPAEQRTASKTLPRSIVVGIWNLNPEHGSITATRATSCLVQFLSRFPAFRMNNSKERIFRPVGMNDSGYAHSETIIPRRASGYERSSNGLQNARFYDMSIPFAAGALYSTVGDLFCGTRRYMASGCFRPICASCCSSRIWRTTGSVGEFSFRSLVPPKPFGTYPRASGLVPRHSYGRPRGTSDSDLDTCFRPSVRSSRTATSAQHFVHNVDITDDPSSDWSDTSGQNSTLIARSSLRHLVRLGD